MLDTIAMAAQLDGEYKTVFEKADMYGMLENGGDESVIDDKMMNLFDLLMQAQTDKMPVSKVIGEDIEEFCKSYFKEEKEKKFKWLGVLKFIYDFAWWGVIAGILEVIIPEEGSYGFIPEVDIIPFIAGGLVGAVLLLLVMALKKTVLKSKKLKPIIFYFLILFIVVISFVAAVIISFNIGIELKIKAGLLLFISALYVIVYLSVRSVWRYQDHGTITKYSKEETSRRKEEKKEKEAFNKDIAKQNVAQTAKDMKSRYQRFSRRHEKKYGKPMTLQQYKEKLTKELKSFDKYEIGYIVMDALFVLVPTIRIIIKDGITDGLIYGLVMVVVFFFVYRFQKWTNNISKESYYEMIYVLDLCVSYDLDLDTVGEAAKSEKISLAEKEI